MQEAIDGGELWPAGHYCILRSRTKSGGSGVLNDCPPGFVSTNSMSDHNLNARAFVWEIIDWAAGPEKDYYVAGTYNGQSHFALTFCCK